MKKTRALSNLSANTASNSGATVLVERAARVDFLVDLRGFLVTTGLNSSPSSSSDADDTAALVSRVRFVPRVRLVNTAF